MSWVLLPLALRLKRPGWPAIWLPLIVLWPLILGLFCLALPLGFVVPARDGSPFSMLVASYRLLCALHGTVFELGSAKQSPWMFSFY